MPRPAPTDIEVCRYIDAECEPAEREAIERALAEHPESARRAAAWRSGDSALRSAFGSLGGKADSAGADAHATRESVLDPLQASDLARSRGRATVAAVASFIAGALFTAGAFALLHLGRMH
jgi:anti-sigma factor RsiW